MTEEKQRPEDPWDELKLAGGTVACLSNAVLSDCMLESCSRPAWGSGGAEGTVFTPQKTADKRILQALVVKHRSLPKGI